MVRLSPDLPDIFRRHGAKVVELDGWEKNGRDPEHGTFAPVGVLNHHTGSYDDIGDSGDDLSYAKWLAFKGRDDLPAPLCNLSVSDEGVIYFCAAGRANHAGKARASGTVAAGDGNTLYVGIEGMNSGTQGWSKEQYGALVLANALLNLYVTGNSAATDRGHKETSVTGKWDPGRLDMDKFRADVRTKMEQLRRPPAKTNIEKFRESRPKYNVRFLDAAVANGRMGTVKKVRDGLASAIHSLPNDTNDSLVHQVKQTFSQDRIIDLGKLNRAVLNGRHGTVQDVRDQVVYLINSLPKA